MKHNALFILDNYDLIYGGGIGDKIKALANVYAEPLKACDVANGANAELLRDCEVIFSAWGAPVFDKQLLDNLPKLKAVFYGAGTIKYFTTSEFWERGIKVSSAWCANAVPVSELTLALIIMTLKKGFAVSKLYTEHRGAPEWHDGRAVLGGVHGMYGSVIGLVSLGVIGQYVAKLLQPFNVQVIAYDPYVTQEAADSMGLGVTMTSLGELFAQSDVVSLHTPWLPETEKLITKELFSSMKQGAAFINTSRGAVIDEQAFCEVFAEREDLYAVLDVTYPEPPDADSPLWALKNTVILPHIAGSQGSECLRHGEYMLEEYERYLSGEPLKYEISEQKSKIMA